MTDKEIFPGQYFWATLRGKLFIIQKSNRGEYYICGQEVDLEFNEFEFIEFIPVPKGHEYTEVHS